MGFYTSTLCYCCFFLIYACSSIPKWVIASFSLHWCSNIVAHSSDYSLMMALVWYLLICQYGTPCTTNSGSTNDCPAPNLAISFAISLLRIQLCSCSQTNTTHRFSARTLVCDSFTGLKEILWFIP